MYNEDKTVVPIQQKGDDMTAIFELRQSVSTLHNLLSSSNDDDGKTAKIMRQIRELSVAFQSLVRKMNEQIGKIPEDVTMLYYTDTAILRKHFVIQLTRIKSRIESEPLLKHSYSFLVQDIRACELLMKTLIENNDLFEKFTSESKTLEEVKLLRAKILAEQMRKSIEDKGLTVGEVLSDL